MRSAVIGLGNIGKIHAKILAESGLFAAVCDVDGKKLERFEGLPAYTDYRKMIDEQKPDAVHVCTPHFLHAEMVVYALGRGVNVLCEKPLCINIAQMDEILEAEKHSKARLGVCLQNRYNREIAFAKEYLSDKRITSAVGYTAWRRTAEYYATGDWRGRKDTEGGGVLINQAIHTLDLMQYLCGMPEKIIASVSNLTLKNSIEVEDTAVILSAGGAPVSFFATNGAAADMPVEITVLADGKTVKIMPGCIFIDGIPQTLSEEKYRQLGKACYGSGHGALIADYYSRLESGEPFPIDGSEGAKSVRLVLAAYRSGGEVTRV